MPFLASRAPTRVALLGWASLSLLASCLDFERYGEAPGAGAAPPGSGGAPAGGSPALGGDTADGGSAVSGGSGEGGEGGAKTRPMCHDDVVDATEECEDALGPPGACVECKVVCEGDDEIKIGTHCYYLDPNGNRNWAASKTACNGWREGSYIASVETQAEQSALEPLFQGTIWLGGHKDSGTWGWESGPAFGFENWDSAQGQPNNDAGEDCMGVWQDSTAWHDMTCSNTNQYLCEWAPPSE